MLFYFKLTDGSIVEDIEGLELPDLAAAREEAVGLARDLHGRPSAAAGTGQTGRSLSRTIRVSRSFGCPFSENRAGN
jgi:hypothetical protein